MFAVRSLLAHVGDRISASIVILLEGHQNLVEILVFASSFLLAAL